MTSSTLTRPAWPHRAPDGRSAAGMRRQEAPAGQGAARRMRKRNLVATLLIWALVMPPALTLPMDSPKVTATRGVLLLFFIPAFLAFMKGVGSGQRRLRFSDFAIVLTCLWMFMALSLTEGVAVAAISANLVIMELLGGYLLARAYFASRPDIEAVVAALRNAVIFVVCVAVFDHMMGQNWVNDTTARLFGAEPIETQFRKGFLRAMATSEHAILFGTFCTIAGGILYFGRKSTKSGVLRLLLCFFGCLLALSSAPLLSFALLIGLIVYDRLLQDYPWRWYLVAFGIVAFVTILCVFSNSPIEALLRRFTLEPQTAFYRLLIWRYAGDEILNAPLIGIGHREWARIPGMTGSVDSLWLVQALAYGIPASVLLGITLISSVWPARRISRTFARDPYLEQLRTGLTIILLLVIFIGFTVHLWGAMLTLFGLLMGMRTTIEEIRTTAAPQSPPARRAAQPIRWPAAAASVPAGPRIARLQHSLQRPPFRSP